MTRLILTTLLLSTLAACHSGSFRSHYQGIPTDQKPPTMSTEPPAATQ
ncbi:hypothetical protein QS306_05225 [Paraburkholderia bonniea]|nr:hypothetical protein [Paraburkholderia bonniea]WJF91054.1 hypothetical protein QS306_05225 [Paraburkholderia bonniea]WJF94368.1 hypothetical protein QS308_05230 [Paraburkholderia bonniea]